MKLAVLVAAALLAAAPAKKKKAPDTSATDAAIKKLLDAEQQHVADCVVAEAPQGAWALTVRAKLSINGSGQVLSATISFDPARSEKTRACVDQVLRAVPWPKSASALTDVSREWQFAMK